MNRRLMIAPVLLALMFSSFHMVAQADHTDDCLVIDCTPDELVDLLAITPGHARVDAVYVNVHRVIVDGIWLVGALVGTSWAGGFSAYSVGAALLLGTVEQLLVGGECLSGNESSAAFGFSVIVENQILPHGPIVVYANG